MKERYSWLKKWKKTLFLGTLAAMALFSITVWPYVGTSYAGHGGGNLGYALAGAAVGACATAHAMNQTRPATTVIVTDPHAGQAFYNGLWYPRERCVYDSNQQPTYCE